MNLNFIMPSIDTIPFRITTNTVKEIEKIRKVISEETGVDVNKISKKQAEIILRIKSTRGKVYIAEIRDVLLGKIR